MDRIPRLLAWKCWRCEHVVPDATVEAPALPNDMAAHKGCTCGHYARMDQLYWVKGFNLVPGQVHFPVTCGKPCVVGP